MWLLHLPMLKRSLIFIHRWLGVALCVIFLLWFPSGIGMMYWRFPTVTPEDRLERSPKLDPSKVVLSPIEAAAKVGIQPEPAQVRLNTFDGRPVYRFGGRGQGNDVQIVYADTGEEQIEVPQSMLDRAASAWTGQPASAATVRPVEEVDQWTVQGQFRNLGPLWKYSWPNGEEVYVSEATGEVVQYTTTASRIGAYLGPIPHWLYFTPLRKHGPTWSQVVIWSSAIGTFAALAGVIIAIWMYSLSRRYRYFGAPSSIPYRGQKRWHMVLGLIFGIATATWAFSGMLSMDPFPRSASRGAGRRGGGSVAAALRGRVEMDDFARRHPRDLLRHVANLPIKELEFTSFAGEAMYAATLGDGRTQMISLAGEPIAGFDHQRIVDLVKRAAPDANAVETRLLNQYDRYYLDRDRRRPLPVVLALMNDDERTRYYIDPKTARVVGGYSNRNWVGRWLYNGLHSLDFPWLYNYRPLWDIVVIAFMLGGTALCVTSLVLSWRVIGRKLKRLTSPEAVGAEAALSETEA